MGSQGNQSSRHYSRESQFVCNECSKAYFNNKDVVEHLIDAHCNSYFYQCHLCLEYFGNRLSSLFQHQKHKHKVTNCHLACPLCKQFVSPRKEEVMAHFENIHSRRENVYVCKYCRLVSKFTLDSHFNEKHTDYVCVFRNCRAVCLDHAQLFSHYIDYHFPRLTLYYDCSECDSMFPKKNSLYQHKRDKHDIIDEEDNGETTIEFDCSLCSYTTYNQNVYRRHYTAEHPNDLFICPVKSCNYETQLFWSITQHVIDKHLSCNIVRYFCHECEEDEDEEEEQVTWETTKVHSLIQHLRDKHSVVNSCSMCVTYEEDLSDHILEEPDHWNKYFLCVICKDEYEEKFELVDHILDDHTNILPLVKRLCFGGAL